MITATFTELRKNTGKLFDSVETGENVEVVRHGKPVAIISPYKKCIGKRWKAANPTAIPGVILSKIILAERKKGYG